MQRIIGNHIAHGYQENGQRKSYCYPKFLEQFFIGFFLCAGLGLLGHQLHSTFWARTWAIFYHFGMHGTGPLLFGAGRSVLLLHQIHPTNGAIASFIIGFVSLALHGAIEGTITVRNRFFLFFLRFMMVAFSMNTVTASIFFQSFLELFNWNVLLHLNHSLGFFQIYLYPGNPIHFGKGSFYMISTAITAHSVYVIGMFHLVCFLFKTS